MRAGARLAFILIVTLWAGIIIGVSLIATPVKFQAPSLTMQTGLEVGRYTFRLLARIELCFLIAAVVLAGLAQPRWITIGALVLVAVQIALQRYWLLPDLDHRVSQILLGAAPAFSMQHVIYAIMEALKAALLIAGAVLEFRAPL